MKRKILFIIFIILSSQLIYSCSVLTKKEISCPPQKVIEYPIIQKCEIPDIPEPKLYDLKEYKRYDEKLQKLIENYGILLEDNKRLRELIKICK